NQLALQIPSEGPFCCAAWSRLLNAIELRFRPNEQRSVGDGVGRERARLELIAADLAELGTRFDDDGLTSLALEVDLSVGEGRRCGEAAAQTLLPNLLAAFGVQAGGDAAVAHDIQVFTDQ